MDGISTELAAPKQTFALEDLDLYRLFAACFSSPSPDRFAWLTGRDFRTLLKQLEEKLEGRPASLPHGHLPDYPAYEAAYLALFEVGLSGPAVPLVESAHTSHTVPQDIVLECVNFYGVLGLQPSRSAFPPDHLVTQLEFLAAVRYLREHEADPGEAESLQRLERDFLTRHLLSWLPSAQKKLAKLDPPLFPRLLNLLCAYATQQLASIATSSACG
jgi:DMSO reductase family type II enzyme chaperone